MKNKTIITSIDCQRTYKLLHLSIKNKTNRTFKEKTKYTRDSEIIEVLVGSSCSSQTSLTLEIENNSTINLHSQTTLTMSKLHQSISVRRHTRRQTCLLWSVDWPSSQSLCVPSVTHRHANENMIDEFRFRDKQNHVFFYLEHSCLAIASLLKSIVCAKFTTRTVLWRAFDM